MQPLYIYTYLRDSSLHVRLPSVHDALYIDYIPLSVSKLAYCT